MAAWGLLVSSAPGLAASQLSPLRPTPDISLVGFEKSFRLSQFRGQPIVLLLAPSPKHRTFRKQVRELESMCDRFLGSNVLFMAAFQNGSAGPIASNIPFLVATSGFSACESYGSQSRFSVAIIGADGNLDYQTRQLLHAGRIREVLQNSFTVQRSLRAQ
jgi:hypothetical protein